MVQVLGFLMVSFVIMDTKWRGINTFFTASCSDLGLWD